MANFYKITGNKVECESLIRTILHDDYLQYRAKYQYQDIAVKVEQDAIFYSATQTVNALGKVYEGGVWWQPMMYREDFPGLYDSVVARLTPYAVDEKEVTGL